MVKLLWFLAVVLVCGAAAQATDKPGESALGKATLSPEQVAALRERGPDGLAEALRVYDGLQQEQSQRMFSCFAAPEATPSHAQANLEAWRAAIDQIGAQRGCTVSRLYWYTDFN